MFPYKDLDNTFVVLLKMQFIDAEEMQFHYVGEHVHIPDNKSN